MRRGLRAQHDLYLEGVVVATINAEAPGYPRFDIDPQRGIAGWHDTPDFDSQTPQTSVGRRGEYPNPRASRGKTLTYNLIAKTDWPGGVTDLEDFMHNMHGAFNDESSIALLVATPWSGIDEDIWATFGTIIGFTGDDLLST